MRKSTPLLTRQRSPPSANLRIERKSDCGDADTTDLFTEISRGIKHQL